MQGADAGALRTLAAAMKSGGERLAQIGNETLVSLNALGWDGPDAESFRHAWTGDLKPKLSSVVATLGQASETLFRQADEQDRASGVASGPGGGGAGGGGARGIVPSQGGGGLPPGQCVVPSAFDQFFASTGWFAASSAVGLTGLKLDSLLAQGAFKAGAGGGPGLWQLSKMGYPSQAPGWLDEATGVLYDSAKFGGTGQAMYGLKAFTRGVGWLGVGAGVLQFAQAASCGGPDAGWKMGDAAISTAFAAAAMVPGPVGVAGTVLSIGWGALSQACGGKPVTKTIADGVSSVWNSIFG